ncbi:MAG: MFS transporter [Deltaproteobacteria bacterium]
MIAVGQTLGYATLYYTYGALLVPISEGTGWSLAAMAFGLSLTLLVSAIATPWTGRLVDRGYGAELLTYGAALGGVILLAMSQITRIEHWYLAWALLGFAGAASLYETCFAWLTRRLGRDARTAITRVTLVAGFASSFAFPFGAYMAQQFGWRGALIAFGCLQLFISVPLNWYAGHRLRQLAIREGAPDVPDDATGALRIALHKRTFWVLMLAFGMVYLNHTMLVTYFIPLFSALGASAVVAVAAASCLGPAQVAGRVFLMARGAREDALMSTRTALLGIVLASLVLLAAGAAPMLIFGFAVLQGASYGTLSILRPVLVAEVLGRAGFGAIAGTIAIAPLTASALAPILGARVLEQGGPLALGGTSLCLASAGFALSFLIRRESA